MRLARLGITALLLLAVHLPSNAAPACADGLLLHEILAGPASDWDGSGAFSSRDDEWIEVFNSGTAPLDLSGYFVTDADSIPRYGFAGVLAPGGMLAVYGRQSVEWERANGQPVFGLSLGNSGDSVLLWRASGTDTTLVDRYDYRSHEAAADRASGRAQGTLAWQVFDARNPYTGTVLPAGNGCAPTPGLPNACTTTSARPASWGHIKSLYR